MHMNMIVLIKVEHKWKFLFVVVIIAISLKVPASALQVDSFWWLSICLTSVCPFLNCISVIFNYCCVLNECRNDVAKNLCNFCRLPPSEPTMPIHVCCGTACIIKSFFAVSAGLNVECYTDISEEHAASIFRVIHTKSDWSACLWRWKHYAVTEHQ